MKTYRDRLDGPHQAFVDEVASLWPLAKGSLAAVKKPCTRKGCKSCAAGLGHPAHIYTYREGKRMRCLHVRPGLVPYLRQALENGRKLEAMLVRLGHELVLRSRDEDA
jgi:hypothetical protein